MNNNPATLSPFDKKSNSKYQSILNIMEGMYRTSCKNVVMGVGTS